jgi:hypothetical protein
MRKRQDLENIRECLSVANMIVDKDHRDKVISRLYFLQSKIEKNETVDLSMEADNYAREYNITPTVDPSRQVVTPIMTVNETNETMLMMMKSIVHTPDIAPDVPKNT